MESSYVIVSSLRRTRGNLDKQKKSTMDFSLKLNEDTDRRDGRQTRRYHRHNLNHHQSYSNLMNYERLNIVDSSTSQATKQNTKPRNKSSLQLRKRPQKFTNQEKIDAINRIHDGEHKMAVARDINVPESTLRGWCKLEKKIRSQLNNFLRTSENYEHVMSPTSSSDNNDNSPAIDTVSMSNISALSHSHPSMRASENYKHIPMTVSMSNISALSDPFLRDQLLRSYFYNQLANGAVMKAYLDLYNSSLSISGQSLPTASFSNDDPYMHRSNDVNSDVTMTNITLASNALVNANSAPIHTENPTVLNNPKGVSSRKQNNQSPYTEEPSESIPQISNRRLSNSLSPEFFDPSRSISQPMNSRAVSLTSKNNDDVITTISSKSSKLRKTLSVAVCQQQQRFISAVSAYNTGEENMFNNVAINNNNSNNNNNVDHVNNEINNRRLSNSLSSEFFDPSRSTSQPTNSRTFPSTSRNNSEMVSTISSKSSKNRKKLSTIVYQLQQGFLPHVPGTGEEDMFDSNNNNNDVDYVDNKTSNRNSRSLLPDFSEILSCCIKLLEWLENHGSAVCTFQQVAQIRRVLDNLINFASSKENEARDKANDRI